MVTSIITLLRRYRWPVSIGALLLVQSAPLPGKLIGVALLCAIAVLDDTALLLLVAATTPLYLMPVALTQSAAIPLHEIIWVMAVATWGISRWRQHQPLIVWRVHDRMIGVFLICAILAVVWALPEGRGEAIRWLRWLFIEPIVWYLCIRTAITTHKLAADHLVYGMVVSAGVVACIGVLQAVGVDVVPWLGSKRAFSENVVSAGNIVRVASVYGHPNNLGLFLERVWPFALISVLIPQWRSRTTIIVLGICAVGLLLTFSRGAWLACGLATAIICARVYGATFIRRYPWILVVGAGVAVIGVLLTLLTRGASAGSLDARLLLWQESIAWLQRRPWGLGLGQFYFYHNPEFGHSIIDASLIGTSEQYAAHPHNLFLDVWLNLGPWGVIALAGILWHAWQRSIVTPHTRWVSLAAGVMLLAASIHGLVDQFYFVSDISYCFWVAICMIDVDTAPSPRL